jgi:hypothetical protein
MWAKRKAASILPVSARLYAWGPWKGQPNPASVLPMRSRQRYPERVTTTMARSLAKIRHTLDSVVGENAGVLDPGQHAPGSSKARGARLRAIFG